MRHVSASWGEDNIVPTPKVWRTVMSPCYAWHIPYGAINHQMYPTQRNTMLCHKKLQADACS